MNAILYLVMVFVCLTTTDKTNLIGAISWLLAAIMILIVIYMKHKYEGNTKEKFKEKLDALAEKVNENIKKLTADLEELNSRLDERSKEAQKVIDELKEGK